MIIKAAIKAASFFHSLTSCYFQLKTLTLINFFHDLMQFLCFDKGVFIIILLIILLFLFCCLYLFVVNCVRAGKPVPIKIINKAKMCLLFITLRCWKEPKCHQVEY